MVPSSQEEDDKEYPCLIRATDGKQIEFSTRVCSSLLPKHYHDHFESILMFIDTTWGLR